MVQPFKYQSFFPPAYQISCKSQDKITLERVEFILRRRKKRDKNCGKSGLAQSVQLQQQAMSTSHIAGRQS
jgi:hypothetical protein